MVEGPGNGGSEERSKNDHAEQRNPDGDRKEQSVAHGPRVGENGQGTEESVQEAHAQLAGQAGPKGSGHVRVGEALDDNGRGLDAYVAAHGSDQGHEKGELGKQGQFALVATDDGRG